MDRDRINLLAADVYDYIFQLLDGEPELTGGKAGKVATALEREFIRLLEGDNLEEDSCEVCGNPMGFNANADGYFVCAECQEIGEGIY